MRTPDPQLAARYEAACRTAIEECRQLNYHPSVWASMIDQLGAVESAVRLLRTGDAQPGFERLIKLGRHDLTIEASVLNSEWGGLFSREVKDAARFRLRQAGFEPN